MKRDKIIQITGTSSTLYALSKSGKIYYWDTWSKIPHAWTLQTDSPEIGMGEESHGNN